MNIEGTIDSHSIWKKNSLKKITRESPAYLLRAFMGEFETVVGFKRILCILFNIYIMYTIEIYNFYFIPAQSSYSYVIFTIRLEVHCVLSRFYKPIQICPQWGWNEQKVKGVNVPVNSTVFRSFFFVVVWCFCYLFGNDDDNNWRKDVQIKYERRANFIFFSFIFILRLFSDFYAYLLHNSILYFHIEN